MTANEEDPTAAHAQQISNDTAYPIYREPIADLLVATPLTAGAVASVSVGMEARSRRSKTYSGALELQTLLDSLGTMGLKDFNVPYFEFTGKVSVSASLKNDKERLKAIIERDIDELGGEPSSERVKRARGNKA